MDNNFGPDAYRQSTIALNDSVCRLRMQIHRMAGNFTTIDTVYAKVSLGGLARQCSALVSEMDKEIQSLKGQCWASINDDCGDQFQLSFDEWMTIGQTPPAWLRDAFERATLLTAAPDQPSIENIRASGAVLVLRADSQRTAKGLLPQVAALMPAGFSADATRIWWPWVMGGDTPVVLVETDIDCVFQEVAADDLIAQAETALLDG
jgi:hypothetical protein